MMLQILHCAMRILDNDVNDENYQGSDGDGDDDDLDDDRGGDDHDDDDDQCGDVDDDDDAQGGDDDDDCWRLAADQIPGRRQVATCVTPRLISCIH